MYLKCHQRKKDGKEHRYWSIVESRRTFRSVVQRQVLYLGEINDSQCEAWRKAISIFDEGQQQPRELAIYSADKPLPDHAQDMGVSVRLDGLEVRRPRQWGACWLALQLWNQLKMDEFWRPLLGVSREGTDWTQVLCVLTVYRLLAPGSEWRLHRQWFEDSAMADLLEGDFALAAKDTLYRCHDRLLEHRQALFTHLNDQWRDLFNTDHEVLLYDLTSTYFESDPPFGEEDKRRYGYSRDHRSDCVQIVIALVITTGGFPLAYEVLPGNTIDNQTLKSFLAKIQEQYGKARRIWLMDRGIPTEEVLAEMRSSDPPASYLVGTPKGRLTKLGKELADKSWQSVREGVDVKLLVQEGETYVLARSKDRVAKERAMRRKRLRRYIDRLKALQKPRKHPLTRDKLLKEIGAAEDKAGRDARQVEVTVGEPGAEGEAPLLSFRFNRGRIREARRKEGQYLLRTNMAEKDPAELWNRYMTLVQVEEAFRNLKGDLGLRPIWHQNEKRIEAHVFVSFLAYCLHVTLKARLKALAPGLTPRSLLEKLKAMQMLDIHIPTTDGRELVLPRYTQPTKEVAMILEQLKLNLPTQPRPRITASKTVIT